MNLRQIEVFRAVMLTGTISGAAKLLCVSPPAVSRLLAHTEITVGLPLFERIKGRLHATPEARRLFSEVENAYIGIQRVNTVARELLENRHGSLRIASHATIGGALVPRALSRFHQEYENIGINFECVRQSELKERLLNQQADLGITPFPLRHPNLSAIQLCDVPIVSVISADHPLSKWKEIDAIGLSRYPIIGYEKGTPFGLVLDDLFSTTENPIITCMQAGTPHEACALIRAGVKGIGIVDLCSAEEFSSGSNSLKILPISGAPLLQACFVYRRYEPMSMLSKSFIGLMRKMLAGS